MKTTTKKGAFRNTRQRQRILEVLRATDQHPTADWIYEQLKPEFPKLSLGTVYRNLAILQDQGLIHKLHCGSAHDRFEAHIDPHYHLICQDCGRLEDFEMPGYNELNGKANKLTDFTIQTHRIEFFGLCSECAQRGESQEA